MDSKDINLRAVVEDTADEWVHRALGKEIDLGIVREIALAHGAAISIGAGAHGRGCKVGLTFPHG